MSWLHVSRPDPQAQNTHQWERTGSGTSSLCQILLRNYLLHQPCWQQTSLLSVGFLRRQVEQLETPPPTEANWLFRRFTTRQMTTEGQQLHCCKYWMRRLTLDGETRRKRDDNRAPSRVTVWWNQDRRKWMETGRKQPPGKLPVWRWSVGFCVVE